MKRLVVCFDGTWNAADNKGAETNVAKIARAVRANSKDKHQKDEYPQLVLYLRGVGSSGPLLNKLFAGATGAGVSDNIRSAYMFLCQNYEPERKEGAKTIPADEIFLFGFSRGAYSARSLSGLIRSCGLLKRQKLDDMPKAWSYYKNVKQRDPNEFVKKYKTDAHTDVGIQFLGVWDTVGALGIPVGILGEISEEIFEFHDTEPSRIVRNAAHALAIDEFRDEFVPTLWTGQAPPNSTIEQVWFAGCHSDVGGGYNDRALADIPLRWMAQRAEDCGLRLDWDEGILPKMNAKLDPLAAMHDSRDGWSFKDRISPTIRRVLEKDVQVSLTDKLYIPKNKNKILRTLGERLHESVIERYGKYASVSPDDKVSTRKKKVYEPVNIVLP
jgi:uncharacterized protein (DUF2235 family)